MPKHIDLSGKKLGKLTAIDKFRKNGLFYWNCICDCGNTVSVIAGALNRKDGPTRSCGCLQKENIKCGEENPNYKHGHSVNKKRSRVFSIWTGMMQRCYNKNDAAYVNYGGRGIDVCDKWHNFTTFVDEMGEPERFQSIERIDNNKGYSRENCKWAAQLEQVRNRRVNIYKTFNGQTKTLSEWAEECGINYFTLHSRVVDLGWDFDIALMRNTERKKYKTLHHEQKMKRINGK